MNQAPYLQWILDNVPPDPTGRCREISLAMAAAFPALERVRGHYLGLDCLIARPHWWLVDPNAPNDRAIIDPTAAQWLDGGRGWYEPHDESSPEPTGKCPNCGGYSYEGRTLCSAICERSYVEWLEHTTRDSMARDV